MLQIGCYSYNIQTPSHFSKTLVLPLYLASLIQTIFYMSIRLLMEARLLPLICTFPHQASRMKAGSELMTSVSQGSSPNHRKFKARQSKTQKRHLLRKHSNSNHRLLSTLMRWFFYSLSFIWFYLSYILLGLFRM